DIMLAANRAAGPIERQPITFETYRVASRFTLRRFMDGCARLFRSYLALGMTLIVVYALSGAAYLAFIIYGYKAMGGRAFLIGWTVIAALSAGLLFIWITIINVLYLLVQVSVAVDGVGLPEAYRRVARFIHAEFRELTGVFLVVLVLVV